MPSKGTSITLEYFAENTSTNQGQTGDSANHTLRWLKDGTSAAPTNSPAQVDGTNAPGLYKITMTATECNCDVGILAGKSSTSNVIIRPVTVTFENPGDVWDIVATSHLAAGTFGAELVVGGGILLDTTISGTPTSTSFDIASGVTVSGFYDDQLFHILSGTGVGQARPILSYTYNAGTRTITIDEAFATTPASGDRIVIRSSHVHPITQVASQILGTAIPGSFASGTLGYIIGTYIDAAISSRLAASSYSAPALPATLGTPRNVSNSPYTKTFTQGDTRTAIADQLIDSSTNSPINLAGSTVAFRMVSQSDSTVKVNNASATLTDAPNGKVAYSWTAGDVDTAGMYWGWWIVTTGGKTEHFPGDGEKMTVKIVASE